MLDAAREWLWPAGSAPATLRLTRAILAFCEAHGIGYVDVLKEILSCLERKDHVGALEAWKTMHRGKDSFYDSWPQTHRDGESPDIALATFEALSERWLRLMSLLDSGRPV